jgi:hypothetical protein
VNAQETANTSTLKKTTRWYYYVTKRNNNRRLKEYIDIKRKHNSFGLFPGKLYLLADVSEHCVCSILIGEWILSVPKRRLLNTTRRGTTQKIIRNIQNMAKA